jgi:6-phosphogluconolactonase
VSGNEERSKTEAPRAYARARAGTPKTNTSSGRPPKTNTSSESTNTSSGRPALEVLPDAAAVAGQAAAHVASFAREAVADHDRFTLAVSGGRTPWAMFAALASEEMPWEQTAIFQVDERVAPAGDGDRNLTHLRASLPAGGAAEIHPMPVEGDDLEAAAAEYARELPERFDLIHLGLGPDGHTASLIPGDPVLEVADRDVALTGVYQGRRRMTLTYPALGRAKAILWLVAGGDKAQALGRLLARDGSIPAGQVEARHALIVADEEAAGEA